MQADDARDLLLAQPGATEETPFGPDVLVYKVGGKMFATLAFEGESPRANLKCDPDRALDLRDRFEGIIPGYHMNKRHWNTLVLDADIPDSAVHELVAHSHALVVAGLPKKERERLPVAEK